MIWLASATASPSTTRNTTDRSAHRHAARGGDVGIDRREQQRPADHGEHGERGGTDQNSVATWPSVMPRKLPNSSEFTPFEEAVVQRHEQEPAGERERLHVPIDRRLLAEASALACAGSRR